jgi:uncharacterized protein (TIGR03000 family)
MRPSWKCLLVVVAVAVALSCAAPKADACWGLWRGCGWGGGWGGYYSGCYSCYSPCYSCYTPCYTTIGCCGSYGYSGWGCGGCGYRSCYGCYSTCATLDSCCGGTTVTPGAPTPAPTPAKKAEPSMTPNPPAPAEPAMPKTSGTSADESGVLTVWVPYDAKVSINGLETKSTGSRRQFVSFGLKSGLSYKYVVKAQVVRSGQTQEDTRTVTLTAGQVTAVAFGFNVGAGQQVASAK